uniref:Mei2-like C-terminal RNA recognition motif domain-containing protein n=1 Tax=Chromera velia CCMP2878 TaxID=1169474 RepID=A0A0G4I6G8_9ALVE|eukprot:Cvel_11360.t1-p1 / transcript=Cvel_11360.t1 / gene=Cvel_11360 / organism=Chromera_velia_CCMP2878 / gene_product=Protein MEI2-like 2, putative / transcript_product=Protein MEI2-like 2, putative / location=Cvel_scaffold712:15284-18849(-) / protein_length=497 / sequence_SO=supercontig / SO=protein_coding / is_pseudo=false
MAAAQAQPPAQPASPSVLVKNTFVHLDENGIQHHAPSRPRTESSDAVLQGPRTVKPGWNLFGEGRRCPPVIEEEGEDLKSEASDQLHPHPQGERPQTERTPSPQMQQQQPSSSSDVPPAQAPMQPPPPMSFGAASSSTNAPVSPQPSSAGSAATRLHPSDGSGGGERGGGSYPRPFQQQQQPQSGSYYQGGGTVPPHSPPEPPAQGPGASPSPPPAGDAHEPLVHGIPGPAGRRGPPGMGHSGPPGLQHMHQGGAGFGKKGGGRGGGHMGGAGGNHHGGPQGGGGGPPSHCAQPQQGFSPPSMIAGGFGLETHTDAATTGPRRVSTDSDGRKVIFVDPSDPEYVPMPDMDGLPKGDNGLTTIMLRNIPNKYTQKMLLDVVNEEFRGLFDFFYLPIDFRNKCNVGYAFINFLHPHYARMFKDAFGGRKLNAFKSNKVCEVSWGRVQGLKNNIEHYRNSAVMSVPIPQYKPMLFRNGIQIAFPEADGPLPSVKLRPQKC